MGDAAGGDRVRQGADHRLLPDHLGEGLRPVLPGEDAIGGRWIGHRALEMKWETERRPRPELVTAASFRPVPGWRGACPPPTSRPTISGPGRHGATPSNPQLAGRGERVHAAAKRAESRSEEH